MEIFVFRLFQENQVSYNNKVVKDDLVGLARDILENNYFEFNETIYGQTMGTAIGTKFAPAFANIFMSLCRKKMLSESSLKRVIW